AVIYHQLGSLAVLLNSMRLLWFERKAGPAWNGWQDRFSHLNGWLERHLDLDEGLHWLGHHAKAATFAVAVLLVAIWSASGLTQVASDEMALVRRFGRLLPE